MTLKCENCGKPILETDVQCWHCGWPVPQQAKLPHTPADEETLPPQEKAESAAPAPFSRASTVAYGTLTAVLILAAVWMLTSLSRAPIVAQNPSTSSADWTAVTDPQQTFTLDLPRDWSWDWTVPGESPPLGQQFPLDTAAAPFGTLVDDATLLLVAESNDTAVPGFFTLTHSDRLRSLTPAEAVSFVTSGELEGISVEQAEVVENLAGQPQARFILRHANGQQCAQLFTAGDDGGYVLGLCGPADRYERYRLIFGNILDSFQRLTP